MTSIKDQPKPKSNSRPAVWDLVINDMQERDALGRHRYGTPLQPFNGRDALVDAYQEALDLAVYLRQAIEERNTVQPPVIEKVPERKTCDRCGKPVGSNDWDIHTCTPPESKRPQPARREKEVQHKETGELSWLDEHEYVGYWMKTTGRMRDLYAEQPKQKCWLCGDMDPAFQARCKVPACGMKEQPAQPQHDLLPNGMTEAETSVTASVMGLMRKPAQPQQEPVALPFGVGGAIVAVKTLLSRDPCVHANTAIEMLDAILATQPAAPAPSDSGITNRYTAAHTAPVQPVASLKEADVLMKAEAHGIDPGTKGLYGFYIDCISSQPAAQPATEDSSVVAARVQPVAWPCVISEADFHKNTVTLEMQCSDYKVGAGQHLLHTTPPATQRQWFGLTQEERLHFLNAILDYGTGFVSPLDAVICSIETKLREKNAAAQPSVTLTDELSNAVKMAFQCSYMDHGRRTVNEQAWQRLMQAIAACVQGIKDQP
jgi:hypothetical protein